MKFVFIALSLALVACGVTPKVDPMSGTNVSAAHVAQCSLQQEMDNDGIVRACAGGADSDCNLFINAFISRYPGLDCASRNPNPLAPGGRSEISSQFVLNYQAQLFSQF